MIPEDMEKIFEPFYTNKLSGRSGTGLGLAITDRLVSMMNGTITLESKLGEGSSFVVKLPCIDESNDATANIVTEDTSDPSIHLAPGRILLMEDEVFNRRLICEFLQDQPLDIAEVSNGKEGLAEARKNRPDLILLDLRMPIMNGYQTLFHLKQDDNLQDVPVIVLSASLLEQEESRALEYGADMFLRKPLSRRELIEAIHRYLPGTS